MSTINPLPKSLQRSERSLTIQWTDLTTQKFDIRDLRLQCPCAHCVDEFTGAPLLDPGTVSENILPLSIRSVGRYALMVNWDDNHNTGIYSYQHLKRIGTFLN
jgi:ATP-binding protein involved in chromosome partitioning